MKSRKFTHLAVILVACALLVGSAIGITVSAEETYTLGLENANVAYNDTLQLAFTLNGGTYPDGATPGIIAWAYGTETPTADNAVYTTFTSAELDGKTYYKVPGVAASDIDEKILVAACYKQEDSITVAGKIYEYSVAEYAGTRLVNDKISQKQATLYSNLLNYGISSEGVLESANNYACVKAIGGVIENYDATVGGWAGLSVLLRAEAKNPAGEYFIGWYNEADELVSNGRLHTVVAPESGVDTYTAKFGSKEDSIYANTVDFEALEAGAVSSVTGISAMTSDQYGKYYVVEDFTGDKELLYDRLKTGSGSNLTMGDAPANTVATEMDVTFATGASQKTVHAFRFNVKNGDNAAVQLRFNITRSTAANSFTMYAEASGDYGKLTLKNASGNNASHYYEKDEIITFGAVLETNEIIAEDETVSYETIVHIYINGEEFALIDLCDVPQFATKKDAGGWTMSKDCYISGGGNLYGLNSSADDMYFDNLAYFTVNPYDN